MHLVDDLRRSAARLPVGGTPVITGAREHALAAVEIVAAAVDVDPTLTEADRCGRDVDLLAELLRQLLPLGRQAEIELQRRRLVAEGAPAHQVERLGRTNPTAVEEVAALGQRAVEIAERIAGAAWPDWNTPARIRERSRHLLPSARELTEIANHLRYAIKASLDLDYPAAEALRLAALAEQIAPTGPRRCAGPDCERELQTASTGRTRHYCGPTCRQRARRQRSRKP